MSRLLAAELFKARTTRTTYGLLIVLVVLTGLVTAAIVGPASSLDIEDDRWQRDLLDAAFPVAPLALVFGILAITNEFRHGTATSTFLVAPRRERVLAAKTLVAGACGLALAAVAALVVFVVAGIWLSARGVALDLANGDLWETVGGIAGGAVVWAILGAGVGAIMWNQTGALVGAFIWTLVVESIIFALRPRIGRYLPGSAIDSFMGREGEDLLRPAGGVAVALAYAAVLTAAGILVTLRRDVS